MVLETGDLFGLHRRFRVVTDPVYILVYPKVVPLPGYDLASRRPIGEIRLTHRLFEDPTRIAGVRGVPARRPAQPRALVGHGADRGVAQQGLRCVDDRRRDDRPGLPPRQLPREERAGPLGAGRDGRGRAGQRRGVDGAARRADHQRPGRRGPDPPSRRDRRASGRAAGRPRGHAPDGRDARGRRPAPPADRPARPRARSLHADPRDPGPRRAERRPDLRPAPHRGRAADATRRHGRRRPRRSHARDGRLAGPPQAPGIRRQRGTRGLQRGRAYRLGRAAHRPGHSGARVVRRGRAVPLLRASARRLHPFDL